MDFVRTCGAFIVLYLQFSIKEAVKDYVKLCDELNLKPALTIFQSGVLSNVYTGYINLASQSDEEPQCTITPYHTQHPTILVLVSFVKGSTTHSMSICFDQNHTKNCVGEDRFLFMKSIITLYYRTDKQSTGHIACLKVRAKGDTLIITCYYRKNITSSTTQVYPTTDTGVPLTGTVNGTTPFKTEPFKRTINNTNQWNYEEDNRNSNAPLIGSVIAAVVIFLGCLITVTAVLLIKYRKRNADAMTKRKVGWQKKNASDEVQVLPEDDAEYTYIDDCPSINAESRHVNMFASVLNLALVDIDNIVGIFFYRILIL
ncbi:hypothetical protein DPMN_032201 [Dreissena polymorpha]|uniref:Uncharacterized protein n=1 Tax=Dreissena polymorpha TaxID=45954 RepID=A0A9D4M1E3_DREPO|nr:hypothetical protein DPMN_032201 [Dreissena polymorpha]